MKYLIAITILVMAAMSCKTVREIQKVSETKTVNTNTRDTTFVYKGGSVSNLADIDSIITLLKAQQTLNRHLNGVQPKVVYKDKDSKVELSFVLDALGRLKVDCQSLDAEYKARIKEINTEHSKQIDEIKKTRVLHVPGWAWVSLLANIILLAIILKRIIF